MKPANGFKTIFGAIRGFNGESPRPRGDVAEEQQGGAASADLLLGLNVDERFSRAGSTVLTDALGSTVGVATGASTQTNYGYDPYGVAQTTGVASTNPYQFTGRENDQTAAGLMYYRARYYNPAWGRFISITVTAYSIPKISACGPGSRIARRQKKRGRASKREIRT